MWKPKPRRKKQRNPRPSEFPWAISVRLTDNLDLFLRKAARKQFISRSELVRIIIRDAWLSGKYVKSPT